MLSKLLPLWAGVSCLEALQWEEILVSQTNLISVLVWPWVTYLPSPNLRFPTCEVVYPFHSV